VASRAGVSESVFTEVFSTVEECYRAAFEQGLELISGAVANAVERQQSWLERVRSGLVALLGFLDDEPLWAHALLLETPSSAAPTLECTQRLHGVLTGLLDQRSASDTETDSEPACADSARTPSALTAELVAGGVFSVIASNLLEGGGKLVELAPSLMAFIVAPYRGQAVARAEWEGRPCAGTQWQGEASGAGELPASTPALARTHARVSAAAIAPAAKLPIRATRRTTLVLRAIALAPYSNNREVAQAAGLADEGQTSKLLARLERKGVIANVGVGPARGEPNAWLLTPYGEGVLEQITSYYAAEPHDSVYRTARAGRRA
jgi:AcrR family transcriptional regulator